MSNDGTVNIIMEQCNFLKWKMENFPQLCLAVCKQCWYKEFLRDFITYKRFSRRFCVFIRFLFLNWDANLVCLRFELFFRGNCMLRLYDTKTSFQSRHFSLSPSIITHTQHLPKEPATHLRLFGIADVYRQYLVIDRSP